MGITIIFAIIVIVVYLVDFSVLFSDSNTEKLFYDGEQDSAVDEDAVEDAESEKQTVTGCESTMADTNSSERQTHTSNRDTVHAEDLGIDIATTSDVPCDIEFNMPSDDFSTLEDIDLSSMDIEDIANSMYQNTKKEYKNS